MPMLMLGASGKDSYFISDGIPDVAPVGFDFDGSYFYIGGMNITKTTKYKKPYEK
jgi:hypothetical protein